MASIQKTSKWIIVVLAVIVAVELFLVVILPVIKDKTNSEKDCSGLEGEKYAECIGGNDSSEMSVKIMDQIKTELEGINLKNVDEVSDIYQKYIDKLPDNVAAIVLINRASTIMEVDEEKQYDERVMNDVLLADSILQDNYSAYYALNAAEFYGKDEYIEKYTSILSEYANDNYDDDDGGQEEM